MNKVAQFLIEEATDLRGSTPELVAVGLLKEAGFSDEAARIAVAQDSMEKQAFFELTHRGIDAEEASKLVKAAGINVKDLPGMSTETDEERLAEILEKAAAYIEQKDARITELETFIANAPEFEKSAEVVQPVPMVEEAMTKIAKIGSLTFEDLEAIRAMPQETLTKMANAMEEPWQIGHSVGIPHKKTDPMLDFLLG